MRQNTEIRCRYDAVLTNASQCVWDVDSLITRQYLRSNAALYGNYDNVTVEISTGVVPGVDEHHVARYKTFTADHVQQKKNSQYHR